MAVLSHGGFLYDLHSTPDLGIACPVQVQDLADGQDAKVGRA